MESQLVSRSSSIQADPLSDVLALLKPRGYMSGGVDAGGDWAIRFEQDQSFRCFALVSGQCWLSMDGVRDPIRLQAGDFAVLPHGRAFCLASDLSLVPVDIMEVIQAPLHGRILSWNGGGDCLALSALFTFAADHAEFLTEALPPVVHIRRDSDRATMRWYLQRMMEVLRESQPGSLLLGEYLAQMMLVETLRLHVADTGKNGVGWLAALADRQINAAMTAMHRHPGSRWTLQQLAALAGMSRSVFALRFKERVGSSTMEYLTRWRMLLVADRLLNSHDSVAAVALSLGYESESAFGFAFKREMGSSPRQYTRQHTRRPSPAATTAYAGDFRGTAVSTPAQHSA